MTTSSATDKTATSAFWGGAIGAGLLASCCGVPLLLGAIGLGTGGISLFLSGWRVPMLLLCMLSMLVSAVVLWRRRTSCDSQCADSNTRRTRNLLVGGVVASLAISAASLGLARPAAHASAPESQAAAAQANHLTRLEIPVAGLTCSGCAEPIRTALGRIAQIQNFEVNTDRGWVRFSVVDDQIDVTAFKRAIESLGYRTSNARIIASNAS